MCVFVCAHTCVWRPEVNLGVVSQAPWILSFETQSLTGED